MCNYAHLLSRPLDFIVTEIEVNIDKKSSVKSFLDTSIIKGENYIDTIKFIIDDKIKF